MKDAKCGDVWMFFGLTMNYLHLLEILYNKPFLDDQRGALHTYGITITNSKSYTLAFFPFLGFRWLRRTELIGTSVRELYPQRAYTTICCDKHYNEIRLDLKCEVLEVEQKHFDKWRGEEMTKKLVDHLSQPDMTHYLQEEIKRIYEGVKDGTFKPMATTDEEEFVKRGFIYRL